jgi:predicted phage terminase large subunit-like protein
MTQALDPQTIAAAFEAELSRRSLLDYCARMIPGFDVDAAHVRLWCELLERVTRGELSRLLLTAAPGHGKSTIVQAWAAWQMGLKTCRILSISAKESLSIRNAKAVRAQIQHERYPFARAALTTEAVTEFELANGSGARTSSPEAIVTGFRADAIVLDDVQADHGSVDTRNSLESYIRGIVATRLEPRAPIVGIATRWGTDDLVARLLAGEDGHRWTHVNLPAIATEDDPHLHRAEGEACWPARWSEDLLAEKRVEVGGVEWETQYQGDPAPEGGAIFRILDWCQTRYRFGDHPEGLRIIQSIDSAWKESTAADWSVIATWGSSRTHFYLLDVWRARVEFPKLKAAVLAQRDLWKPVEIVVEQAASGWAIVQSLRAETRFPIIGIPSTASKISRAQSVAPLFEAGRVILPDRAPFLDAWCSEHERFGIGSGHDDMVDSTSLALLRMQLAYKPLYVGSAPNVDDTYGLAPTGTVGVQANLRALTRGW